MGTVLEILVALLILASFFLVYLGAKTWPIYQVILAWFVFAATLAFVYIAARALKTNQSWGASAVAWQKAIDDVQAQNVKLRDGVEQGGEVIEQGIQQLEHQLHLAALQRGTVWFHVKMDRIDSQTGRGELTIENPAPHDIAASMVLFAFEDRTVEQGGKYLGEFKVTKGDGVDKTIEISPNLPLTDQDRQRLAQAKDQWSLYAIMPIDDAKLYAAMTADERRKLFPGKTPEGLQEYAKADRTLRDYEFFFHQSAVERELLANSIATIKDNMKRIAAAQKKAEQEIEFRRAEQVALTADKQKFLSEQKLVHDYLAVLEKQWTDVQAQLTTSLNATVQAARGIVKIQLKAAEEIDRLTGEQAGLTPPAGAAKPAAR